MPGQEPPVNRRTNFNKDYFAGCILFLIYNLRREADNVNRQRILDEIVNLRNEIERQGDPTVQETLE